jgi:hypothetical protein
MWLSGLFSAISIKFFSSVDDVVWLTPFLTSTLSPALQLQNAAIYTSVCLVQTFVAMTLAFSGEKTVAWLLSNEPNAWSADKVLTVIAGCLMALFGAKELYNHFYGDDDDSEDAGGTPSSGTSQSADKLAQAREPKYDKVATKDEQGESEPLAHGEIESGLEIEQLEHQRNNLSHERGPFKLFQIAFIGSVDDLTLFVPMLVGKAFDPVQLVFGSLTAACCIVSLCMFIGLCKPIANVLAVVPLWFIVITFAVVLLVKGAMMD